MNGRVRELSVTILADDLVAGGPEVLAEHGLSMLVEADGRSFLFDVGQSGVFLGNAAKLGLDLTGARRVVLSHAHYDHTGALAMLLSTHGPRSLVAHPDIFTPKYARRRGRKPRAIGLPWGPHELMRLGAELSLEHGAQEVVPGAVTTGPIARTTEFETIPSHYAVRAGDRIRQDRFEDEQAVVIHTRKGLVMLVGCSHRGLVNAVRHAMGQTGDDRVHAVIGGTHLGSADDQQVDKTIAEFGRLGVAHVVACHCTGFHAAARLAHALGDVFDPGGVGYRFQL
jgi:7,8-dihydropterin-6-yl-methyl-4-(beta-D-ribofuranosyl)aminobenzene 5'-phosphate synthase